MVLETNLVHIVVGLGGGTWDRTNQKVLEKEKKNLPASFGVDDTLLGKNAKTKMTALARSIDLKASRTDLKWNND